MILHKTASIAIMALLLYPAARTFYKMCTFEIPEGLEEEKQDNPIPETQGNFEPSIGITVSQSYFSVSPFDRLHRYIGYGPRKWVGTIGLAATVLIFALLSYSAWFLPKGASHVHEWRIETIDLPPEPVDNDAVINWRLLPDGTISIENSNDGKTSEQPQVD